MSNNIIVQKYSTASFNFAKKKNILDEFLADLKIFSRDISPDFIANSSSPFISKSSLMDSVNWVLDSMKVSDRIKGFLKILIFNKRLDLIEKICIDLESKLKAHNGVLSFVVRTACELKQGDVKKIEDMLQKSYNARKIEVEYQLDQSILGGMVIENGFSIIDASLLGHLNKLQDCLIQL